MRSFNLFTAKFFPPLLVRTRVYSGVALKQLNYHCKNSQAIRTHSGSSTKRVGEPKFPQSPWTLNNQSPWAETSRPQLHHECYITNTFFPNYPCQVSWRHSGQDTNQIWSRQSWLTTQHPQHTQLLECSLWHRSFSDGYQGHGATLRTLSKASTTCNVSDSNCTHIYTIQQSWSLMTQDSRLPSKPLGLAINESKQGDCSKASILS